MENFKIYRFYGVDSAMHLLRPGAKWEIENSKITRWEDPRPRPTWDEVLGTLEKIKNFEESIDTIWLPEQIEAIKQSTLNRYIQIKKENEEK